MGNSIPVTGIASLSLFLGFAFFLKKTYTKRGYSDGQAWIQRRPGMDTVMARRGYNEYQVWIQRWQGVAIATSYSRVCIFFLKTLYRAWIQRRPGMDTETARRGYSDGLDI